MTRFPHHPLHLTQFYITWSSWTNFYNKVHQNPHVLVQMLKLGLECPIGWLCQLEIEEAMVLIRIWLILSHLLINGVSLSWK